MAINAGDTIGDYQVVGILGAGGMGQVYKVRNTISDRIEAIKILLPNLESDPELMDRFLREIKVQASLDHPNIAALHTAQRVGNQLLMIMEYVEGEPLESVLKRGPIPVEYGVDFVSQVLSALSYAHARGVIHRDIKPANIMLMPDGTVKLMDFGIAKMAADRRLTQTGRTVGSLYYMSPEQINGAANLDPRSDLYSLGVALYEIVTGRRPFQGDSDYSIMAAHLQATPVPPIQLDPRVPAPLNEIILTAIAKDPAQRFQSADAFRAALENVKGQLRGAAAAPQAVPAPAAYAPPPQGSSRRWLYMVAGSLATVAVLVFAAVQIPKWRAADASVVQKEAEAPAPAQPAAVQQPEPAPAAAPVQTQTRPPVVQRETAPPAAQPAPPPPPQPTAATAPPAQRGPDPAVQAELRQLRERMMLQATRLNSSKAAIDNMRRVQAQSGLGMRQDVLTAMQRAEFYMDESEGSLKAGDPAAARKNLDSAEREIERLEKFLGR
ncbi:MAG: serine/threonine protein kinase [Acidobacteria bacterium]|nr:serine/threonine protein kinase [Acidobacteriota bacterium]